jgi:phosphoribosyl-ATP pyrophosphohydrolase/phosphoribosyl-AMP cyclohydrolase
MNTLARDALVERLEFDAQGLVPAIVQDFQTNQVLMLGFMTKAMLAKTLESGQVWFWSRSRQEPWLKGATSGNYLNVVNIFRNCEDNSLLILARPDGPTCHTGSVSCYYRALDEE